MGVVKQQGIDACMVMSVLCTTGNNQINKIMIPIQLHHHDIRGKVNAVFIVKAHSHQAKAKKINEKAKRIKE